MTHTPSAAAQAAAILVPRRLQGQARRALLESCRPPLSMPHWRSRPKSAQIGDAIGGWKCGMPGAGKGGGGADLCAHDPVARRGQPVCPQRRCARRNRSWHLSSRTICRRVPSQRQC